MKVTGDELVNDEDVLVTINSSPLLTKSKASSLLRCVTVKLKSVPQRTEGGEGGRLELL